MLRVWSACAVVFGVWLTCAASASPPKYSEILIEALTAEVGEVDDDMSKVLRMAGKCRDYDAQRIWNQSTRITNQDLYEQLGIAMACWQRVEKKSKKLGEGFAPATRWVAAQARHTEFYRDFIWMWLSKMGGGELHLCQRLQTAEERGKVAVVAVEGLSDGYQTMDGKALAQETETRTTTLMAKVVREIEGQDCAYVNDR